MNIVEGIFLFYMFVSLYLLFLFLFILISHRTRLFEHTSGTLVPVSIVMPCYNESEHIGKAIEALLALDYPKDKLELIVVDDRSTDTSAEVVRTYVKKYPGRVRLIVNKRNSGGAAEPTNIGVRAAKYPYIAVADADSFPRPDALRKMIGFLQEDPKVGAVTCAVLAQPPVTFMQRLQAIEYTIIAWNRKLLDCVDAVYVTPGPFALYNKRILKKVGLFDTSNLTQDIEIVWRLRSQGYTARMCLATHVYSATPTRLRDWFKQRIRWNVGGLQTLVKYKHLFLRNGMLGSFIVPFFALSLCLGLFGLGMYCYLTFRRLYLTYLTADYSLYADTALLHLPDLMFSPSILNYFGITLFVAGIFFTILGLQIMKTHPIKGNIFNILFYLLVYLTIYPFIMITALYKYMRGTYSW